MTLLAQIDRAIEAKANELLTGMFYHSAAYFEAVSALDLQALLEAAQDTERMVYLFAREFVDSTPEVGDPLTRIRKVVDAAIAAQRKQT